MAVAAVVTDLVAGLLKTPFSGRSFTDKKEITKGRPIPTLDLLTKASKGFVRHFKDCNYERYEWLTASTEHIRKKLLSQLKGQLHNKVIERFIKKDRHMTWTFTSNG